MKHQPNDLTNVLRRSVESTANSGHSGLLRLRNHPAGKDEFLGFSIPVTTGNIALMLPMLGRFTGYFFLDNFILL